MSEEKVLYDWIKKHGFKNINEKGKIVILNVLDKATPKKPKGLSITYEGRVGNCPSCNRFVREVDIKSNICECGQMLDWE